MISIITVNFNNATATLALLASLERQTDRDFDVCVVDNDSAREDRAALGAYATTSPLALEILYSTSNRGFAGGNNLAIRKAMEQARLTEDGGGADAPHWFILLNNDTTVDPDFIARLRDRLPATPALVGIPLVEENETGTRTHERIAFAGIVRWFRWTLPHLYEFSSSPPTCLPAGRPPSTLLYVIGAGMAVHRNVFERIGLLDERYFLYFEDADFSMRARAQHIPILFLKEPSVRHGVSRSTSRLGSSLLLRYHTRNALAFNATHGPLFVRFSLHFWAFFAMVKQLVKWMVLPSRRGPSRAIASGIIDFYAHRFGKIEETKNDHRH